MKRYVLIISIFLTFLLPQKISAQFVINEMSTYTDSDWVEIYALPNDATNSASLSGYYLLDDSSSGNRYDLSDIIQPGGFVSISWGNKLNKSGDIVRLYDPQDNKVYEVSYGDKGGICAPENESQSVGKYPDGQGDDKRLSDPTQAASNNSSEAACPTKEPDPTNTPTKESTSTPRPTSTSLPTSTPTPKPSPTPTKTSTNTPEPTLLGIAAGNDLNIDTMRENLKTNEPDPEENMLANKKFPILAVIFMILGAGFIGAAVYPFVKNRFKNKLKHTDNDINKDSFFKD